MKLENRFTVPVPPDQAWQVLLDVERVAPCMPGATLTSRDGDDFEGTVKVKVGPINLTYGGKARFASLDEQAHVAVIEASGKETRGTGTAKATITCRLVGRGGSTDVEVDTDLAVTGKPAQFGRGVLGDVSAKLVDQFAACLSREILAGTPSAPEAGSAQAPTTQPAAHQGGNTAGTGPDGAAPGAAPQPTAAAAPRTAERPSADHIDLLDAAGAPVLKRLLPLLVALAVLVLVVRRLRR
jgi:uncharacterized protein